MQKLKKEKNTKKKFVKDRIYKRVKNDDSLLQRWRAMGVISQKGLKREKREKRGVFRSKT